MTRTSGRFSDTFRPLSFNSSSSSMDAPESPLQLMLGEFEDRGTGPVEAGDVIMGEDWGEDEGEARVVPEKTQAFKWVERSWREGVTEVVQHARLLLQEQLTVQQVESLVEEAFSVFSVTSTRADAVAWGEEHHPGSPILPELEAFASSHEEQLRRAGGFEEFVKERKNQVANA